MSTLNKLCLSFVIIMFNCQLGSLAEFFHFNESFDFPTEVELCPFNPDKVQTLFGNDKVTKCSQGDLWDPTMVLSAALTTPPENPGEVYHNLTTKFCPMWLHLGRNCLRNYLLMHCTNFEWKRSQANNGLNFLLSFNDVVCNEGPGKDAFFDLVRLGALNCIKDIKKFRKPFIACLNKSDYMTDLMPIFLGYFQVCSSSLWKNCQTVQETDRERFEGLMKILFKEMILFRRLFWAHQ